MRRLFCLFALVLLPLAACSEASSDSPLAPSKPHYDSGYILGGNKEEPPPTTTSAASDTTTTADRSGYILGGN